MNNEEQSLYQCIDACPAAVAVIDPKCSIQFANTGMLDFLGLALDEVVGSKCFQLVHGTQEAIQGCPLMTMVKNKARAEVEVDLAGRRYKVAAEPIFSDNGRLIGGLHVMADVNDSDSWAFDREHILSQARRALVTQ